MSIVQQPPSGERFLLEEDATRFIKEAEASKVLAGVTP